jgi:UDP-N-acetylmuramoyl-tripeptide--D-alanyl-D-alanine ligase
MPGDAGGRRNALNLVASICVFASVAACGVSRWLRVAQREHYLPTSVMRFWLRWMKAGGANAVLGIVLLASAVAGAVWSPVLLLCAAAIVAWPLGLPIRGRTAPLALTRRLRTLAVVAYVVLAVVGAGLAVVMSLPVAAAAVALLFPFVVDLACAVLAPVEARLGNRFVQEATTKLNRIRPRVVAVTGSYGKTSTKEHIRDLLADRYLVVASPASFNNRLGLARAVNDHVQPGTEVFVAEMGMYAEGEIRALCDWLPPEVAVLTAVGPVHLERLGSLDAIVRAKSEIFEHARVAVINVDPPRLAEVADGLAARGMRVRRCGTEARADIDVALVPGIDGTARLVVEGAEHVVRMGDGTHASNLACAIAVALELDVAIDRIVARLERLTVPAHRLEVQTTERGVTVIDDTFNANPDGAQDALDLLATVDGSGRRVVVTPGMVELGAEQADANEQFAQRAAAAADALVVVGRTNRAALVRGARDRGTEVHNVANRERATEWVRATLAAGDVVLYENDLPDHYP